MTSPWDHILETLKYEEGKDMLLTADQIKAYGKTWKGPANQFEPRLLCYQTSAEARPSAFKRLGLCILPVKNGQYLLTKKTVYAALDYGSVEPVIVSRDRSSVMLALGDSETTLIDNLRYSGVFEREEMLGEPITHGPLLNGRHRISMDMKLGERDIHIQGVQYETDACFESAHKILIGEGKSSPKPIDSFNIRQLYFPYREAMRVAGGKKEVVCVFVHQLGDTIHIWKYGFHDAMRMDSIEMRGHYAYRFSS